MSELALTPAPGITLSATALTITDPNVTFEECQGALDHALGLGDAVRWWVGDLLLFAEARWGEEHAQLIDGLRLSEHQVRRYRVAAERIAPSRRRENLSFSHHEAVLTLDPPDQARLLNLAATSRMTLDALRDAVRDHKAFEEPEPRRRVTVIPASEVDAARGVRTVRNTLVRLGEGISPEAREASGISESVAALPDITKTVKRASALEPLALAVAAVIAAGVRQTGLPDPAVIVPSGPWDTLVAAYATATDGGA